MSAGARTRARKAASLALVAWLAAGAVATPAQAQVVGPEYQLSTPPPYWTNNANEPSIASSGQKLVAAWQWLRGSCNKNVGWACSMDAGVTWTEPEILSPSGPSLPSLAGKPALCMTPIGDVWLAALKCDSDGMSLVLYQGTLGGGALQWQGPTRILVVPYFPNDDYLDRPSLSCDATGSLIYLSYTHQRATYDAVSRTTSYESVIRFVHSADGGLTWSSSAGLSSATSNGSRVVVAPDGEVYVFWQDFAPGQALGRKSMDHGETFGPAFVVGEIVDNLNTPPPLWTQEAGRTNPVYPWASRTFGPDFPAVAIDRTSGPRRGSLYAVWTDHAVGGLDPVTQNVGEVEPNETFAQATLAPLNATLSGVANSSDADPDGDMDFYAFDGEQGTTVQVTSSHFLFPTPEFDIGEPLVLYAEIGPGNAVEITRGRMSDFGPSPPMVFTLPRTGRYYLVVCGGGAYTCVYSATIQVLRPAASSVARDHRDVVLTSSSDGGATWTPKRRVADAPPWFDECMPEVAVDGRGLVHVAWYGRQDDPVLGQLANTYWTVSGDGGFSFGPARRLSTASSYWGVDGGGDTAGDHLGVSPAGDAAVVVWMDQRIGHFRIFGTRITDLPTGIAVPRFAASIAGGRATLTWTVADATGISGFRMHRAEGAQGEDAALPGGEVAVRGEGEYAYEDASARPGTTYRYRLEVLRGGAASEWEGPAEITIPTAITRLALGRPAPNPFDREVRFELRSPREAQARVEVVDVAGHAVATVHAGRIAAGTTVLAWDGRGRDGSPVAPGVYLLRAASGGERVTRRVIRVR